MNDEYLKKLYSYLGAQDSEYHKRTTYDDFKSKMGSEDYSTKVHGYIKGIDSEFRSLEDFNSKIKKKSDWGSTLGSGSSASQKTERKATKEIAKTKDLRNVADKGSEIFTGYPGKEKNQYEFSNGNWYELNPEVEKTIKKSKESYVPVGGLGESYGGGMFVNPSGEGQDFATPGTSKNSLDAIKNVPKKRIIEDDARIKALNKHFGKNASLDEYYETFGDYDNSREKRDNKYRIKNNSWERWVPGAQWSSITNEGSISALNRRYGKNIEAKKDIVVKPKEIDPFLKVNSNFLAQSEESAQQMLEKNFKGMGFTFEQTGVGGDYIKVIPNNGNEPQTFSFNNVGNSTRGAFSSPTGMSIGNNNSKELEKNIDQSVKLQSYLRFNASAEKEDDLSAVNRIKNNISIREKKYDLSPLEKNNEYYNTEDYKNNFKELTFQQKKQEIKRRVDENANLSASYGKGVLGDIYTSVFGEDEKYYKTEKDLKKFKDKLNSSEEYKLFVSEQKKYDAQKREKYDKLYDEWVIVKQSGNKEDIKTVKAKIEGGYSKELIGDNLTHITGSQYDLKHSINDFNKRKEKLQLDAKNGNLTEEQYNDAVEGLSSEAQRLDVAAKNVAATQKKMDALAGVYVTEKAKSGGFFGNFTNSLLVSVDELISSDGLSGKKQRQQDEIEIKSQDITPQQRQYYKDKGYNDEQIKNVFINNAQKNAIAANKRAIIETFGSDLTTEESKQNLGFVEQALVGVAASLPSMALSLIPVVGQAAAFGGMANMSYNAINEEMLNDTDFETTSEGDRAIVAIPYAVVMGALEKVGMNKMLKGESTIGKIVLSRIAKIIPKGATREVIENIANKEVKSLVAKGALKVIGGTLAEAETGALQAGLLDVGLKSLFNVLDPLDLKLTNKEGLTGGEAFATPDTKMGVAGAILEGAAAEAIGGFAMSTVMVGAQGLINGKISLYNEEDLKFFEDFTSDQEFKKLITSNLKTQMLNGTMTKGEAQSALNDIDLVEGVFNSIDENISDEAKIIAFNLINERNRLKKEVIGKDPALSKEKNDRIKDINDKLGTLPLQVLVVNNVERATKLENALKQKGAVTIDGKKIPRVEAETELKKINQKVLDAERKQEEDAIKASIPEEISSLKDDEPFTKTVKTLEEVPEEFRDRAKKSTSKGTITTREKILGLPIGKKITTEVDYGYTYTLTGKEAKDYAIQEQAAGQVPVQPTTEVGEEVVQEEPTAEPQVLTEEGQKIKVEDIESKRIETEAKIKRKDLFSNGGSFSNTAGGSGVDSVPTGHSEINGIEFVQFSNPNTGEIDVVMTGKSDNDFVGFYRIYENGKATNKWSSKFENQSRNKEDFKTMIGGVQSMLPQGHEYTEKTSISTDGLRVWFQQLFRGYELQYDNKGNLITNRVAINGDSIINDLGVEVNKGNFDNISVKNSGDMKKVKAALLPYLQKFGLNESNIHFENGTVKIDLPVLKSNKVSETTTQEVAPLTLEEELQLLAKEQAKVPKAKRGKGKTTRVLKEPKVETPVVKKESYEAKSVIVRAVGNARGEVGEYSVSISKDGKTAKVRLKKMGSYEATGGGKAEANLEIKTDENKKRFVTTKNKTKVYIDDVITPAKVETTKAKVTTKSNVKAAPVKEEVKTPVKEEVKNKVVLSAIQKDAYEKLSKKEKEIVDEIIFDENYERSIGTVDILDENLNEKELEDEINRSAISFEDLLNMSLNISLPKTKISEGNEVFTFGKDKYDINKANEIISEESLEEINIPVDALPKMSYSFISVDENTVKNADITKPVILVRTKDGLLLIDGHHRVRKAIIENKPIKAFVLNESQTNQVKEQSTKKVEPVTKVKAEPVKEETEAEKISRGAEMLKNMSEDERDIFLEDWIDGNIPRESLPGGTMARNLYEAKKLVPKPTSKPKRTSIDNAFSLSMDQGFVINIDGVVYGLNKYEDPDATSEATDNYGDPKQYVWAYTDMSKGDEVIETFQSDIDELINEIKSSKKVEPVNEEAPAPAKESTDDLMGVINSIKEEIDEITKDIKDLKTEARKEVNKIEEEKLETTNKSKLEDLNDEITVIEDDLEKALIEPQKQLDGKIKELKEEVKKIEELDAKNPENKNTLIKYIDAAIKTLNGLNKLSYVKLDLGVTVATLKLILKGIRAGVILTGDIKGSIRAMASQYRGEHKNKKITIAEFTKEIEEYLRNTFVDQKTNEQDIQEARDKFVEIREAVRKAKLAVNTKSQESRKKAFDAIRKMLTGKVKNLSAVQLNSIMLRLASFNALSQTQYDKFIDYVDKVIGIADYDDKVAKANENRKNAKKKLPKLGDISSDLLDPLSRVLSINAKLIPSDVFESYAEIVEMLSKRDAVLKLNKRADLNESLDKIIESIESNEQRISDLKELYDNFAGKTADYAETLDEMLKVGLINQAEHKLMKTFKSKIQAPKVKDKMTEQQIADEKVELINEINNTTITLDEIVGNEFRLERDLVKRLQDLLKNKKTLERLNNKDLKDLLRVIDNINNGFVSNATQEMVEKLNFIEKSILLESSIPETFKVITARINQSLEKRISKRINVAPLFNIDQQLGDFKTKNIFNSVFNESAKAQQGYQSAITLIQDELDKIEKGIATSFESEPNKIILSQFKMMVYMMQLEYDSNPTKQEGSKKQVHQAMKTLDETIKFAKQNSEKSGYNNLDIAQMESIKKEFEKDGEIDIDKLYNSFNEAEKNGLKKLQEINDRMTKFATYTATVINGNKIKPLKNYISYTVINESDILSASETTDQINNINANMQPGTVSKNLEERDGKAHPVYLNPFYATNSSSRSVLLNYHMTEPVRTARKTLRNTKTLLEEKKGTTQEQYNILSAISGAYNTATKDLLESNFTQSSKTLEFLKRQGYRAMLASGTRAAAELSSNVIFVLANNKFDMARGLSKQIINIEAVDRKSIMTNLSSTVENRLYPTSSINSPFVELTTNKNRSSKSKNTQTGIRNGVIQAWDETAKKYVLMPVAGLADYVISKPDQLVMRPLWFGAFSRAFEKEAGIKPDFDKIMENNEEYMDKYKDALEKATTVADKQVITSGSSTNAYMGILQNVVRQDDKGGVVTIKEFNRFMNKFTVQEYYTAREGVRALVGNGSISRSDGAHLLAAVTLRMTSYFVFTRLFSEGLAVVARSLGFGGDDDDDDKTAKQKISQGILSSITTLVFGRYFGNFIRVAENYFIEWANETYGEAIGLRDGEYDPYEDAIQFNQLQEGKVDKLTDLVKVVAGPLSPLIGTAELAYKLATSSKPEGERAKLTREKELYRRLPLEIGGLAGVVPFYKDFRKIVMEGVYKELKKETKETAVKKEAEEIKTALTDSQKISSLKEMMNSGEYTREGIKKELRKIKDPEYRKALKDKDDAIRKKILDKYGYENLTDFKRNDVDNYEIEFGDDSPYRIERAESAKIANELEKRLNALEDGEEYYSTEGTAIVAPKKRANKYNRFESRTKVNRYNRFESVKKVNKYNRFE